MNRTHLVIPDMQHKVGSPLWHIDALAAFAEDYEPDVIVQLGDWNDCESAGKWERGKMESWGKAHQKDCDHSRKALEHLEAGLGYGPRKVALEGNHDGSEHSRESRMWRLVQENPHLAGSLECPMQCFRDHGWQVIPHKGVVEIDGISYSHLFNVKADGGAPFKKGAGATNAKVQLSGIGSSCVAGHKPGLEFDSRPFGKNLRFGLIAGSGYPHKLGYQGAQGSVYWRGVLLLHVYKKGQFDIEMWSLDRLKAVYV